MVRAVASSAAVCVVALVLAMAAGASADYVAPDFSIDLGLAPVDRWTEVTTWMMKNRKWEDSFGAALSYVTTIVPPEVVAIVTPILADLGEHMGDYGQEMQGVYNAIKAVNPAANITYGELVGMNLIYELTAYCTSIVAQNTNGTVFHGRNLDYPITGLNNLTARVAFTRNGTVEYYGTAFTGYVGLLTGMRPNGFSVSVDERDVDNTNVVTGLIKNIGSALAGGKSIGMFVRDTLQNVNNFKDAVYALNTTRLISPMYIIVGGVGDGEGCVITRNRTHADDSHGLDNGVWSLALPQNWWRVETNYDHWGPVPSGDDRRDPANKAMAAIGAANINADSLFKVLSIPPILNPGTQYTTVMSPSLGLYEVLVRQQDP